MSSQEFNTIVSTYTVPLEVANGIRAIVISDICLDKTFPISQSIPDFSTSLLKIATRENATSVFILGNIVDPLCTNRVSCIKHFIQSFEDFPIPIYILTGFDDQQLYSALPPINPGSSLKFVHEPVAIISHPNKQHRIVLSHDFNNGSVASRTPFCQVIREKATNIIQEDDFVITGFTGTYFEDIQQKCASLNPFSLDLHRRSYALIAEEGDHHVFTFHKV